MRVLAPVLIVLIICVFVLLYVRMTRKQTVRRQELAEAQRQARVGRNALKELQKEISTQVTAGYFDPSPLAVTVQDFLELMETPERKELKR